MGNMQPTKPLESPEHFQKMALTSPHVVPNATTLLIGTPKHECLIVGTPPTPQTIGG